MVHGVAKSRTRLSGWTERKHTKKLGANFKWRKTRYLSYWYKERSDEQNLKQLLMRTGILSVFFFFKQYAMFLFFCIFINLQLCHICVVWAIKSKLSHQTSGPIKLILGEEGLRSGPCTFWPSTASGYWSALQSPSPLRPDLFAGPMKRLTLP